MIKLQQLCKSYRGDEIETLALNQVDMEMEEGEFIAIMGPSGCGKSTLLNILGMLDQPSSGQYLFKGEDISAYSERQLGQLRKENIGFIFQNFNLIDELSVRENIELALQYHNIPGKQRREQVAEVMDRVGIAHRADHRPGQLSGGQQQRVAVARAVVAKPSLILADEPTGNLDSSHGQEVMKMLQALNREGTGIIMVTHSSAHADYARRCINLFDGQILAENLRAVS
ncbi:ABC transporter ATP-binding protein [Pseudoteredinibacter isoporae]|uniref:ABC transporter ATP-binding protein n=1 Tax=Pseudoteredinibacter isoporae TaxID=570281 RepID=UPI003105DE7C